MVFAFLKLDNQALFTALKNHGFKAVSNENWQELLKGIELLESNDLAHFKIRQEIKCLQEQAVKSSNTDSVNAMLQLSRWVTPTYLTWQKNQIALFNNPAWWDKRLAAAKKLEQPAQDKALQAIPFLQKLWKQQAHYAFYSTVDLINIYETVFPLFNKWLLYAETELQKKRRQLPKLILREYERYLNNVAKSLAYEKQQVRMAFKGRLVAGLTQQNLQFDEIISLMQEDLYALGVLPIKKLSPNQDYPGCLMPDTWLKIQQIIEQDGNEAEKVDWYGLSYNNVHRNPNDPLFNSHYRSTYQGHTYRIPAELAAYIPVEFPFYLKLPAFLHWFFITDRFYYAFFQHATCQYLLAIEESFEQWKCPMEVSLATLEKNHAWQGLQNLWGYLEAEKIRIQNIQENLFIFSPRKITPLLEGYRNHLQAFSNEILRKQISLINEAVKHFQQKSLTEDKKHQLEQLLQQLQQTEKQWKCTANVQIELSQLTLHCHHLLNRSVVTTEILETATIAIDALNQGEKPTSEALDAIKTTQDSLALGECVNEASGYAQARFTIETHLAKEKIPDLLKTELLENSIHKDQKALTRHLQAMKTYHAWVLREKSPLMDPVVLNDQLCYYTYLFLQSIRELPSKQAFLTKKAVIQQVMGTLQYLTETTFPALHRTLISLTKMDINQPLYADDWELFCQCELSPPLNTLKKYLTDRGLKPDLPHKAEMTSQLESENAHTFKKIFSSSEISSPNQTSPTSFNPTFTQ